MTTQRRLKDVRQQLGAIARLLEQIDGRRRGDFEGYLEPTERFLIHCCGYQPDPADARAIRAGAQARWAQRLLEAVERATEEELRRREELLAQATQLHRRAPEEE